MNRVYIAELYGMLSCRSMYAMLLCRGRYELYAAPSGGMTCQCGAGLVSDVEAIYASS